MQLLQAQWGVSPRLLLTPTEDTRRCGGVSHSAALCVSPVWGHRWPGPHTQVLPAQWGPAVSLPPQRAQLVWPQGQALKTARCPPPRTLPCCSVPTNSLDHPLHPTQSFGTCGHRTPSLLDLEIMEAAGRPDQPCHGTSQPLGFCPWGDCEFLVQQVPCPLDHTPHGSSGQQFMNLQSF